MKFDLQKADMWKRISAALFDFIILMTVIVGIAAGLSAILNYDYYLGVVDDIRNEYSEEYGVDLNLTDAEIEKLPEDQRQVYKTAGDEFSKDERVLIGYSILVRFTVVIVACSVLFAYVLLEFVVPLLLKEGRTLGKKIFGLAVIRTNGVRMKGQAHFIRSVIGKCAIETLVPIFIVLMILFNMLGLVGTIVLLLFPALQIFTLCYTRRTRSAIHDLISDTVVVDMASQKIFDTEEELMAYKTRIHAEEVAKK